MILVDANLLLYAGEYTCPGDFYGRMLSFTLETCQASLAFCRQPNLAAFHSAGLV